VVNHDVSHFRAPGVDGFITYRPAGRYVVQLCGPFAADADRVRLTSAFRDWARSQGRRITAVQLRESDAFLYAKAGFTVNQLGASYSIDLGQFSLRGTRFMKTRNKIKRAGRLGITVEELSAQQIADESVDRELDAIDASWLRGKGRLARELTFMVGERGGPGQALRRIFVARHEGRAIAYVTYSPCYGQQPGWLYDLTRRRADSPPGVVELVFHSALEQLRDEGVEWLHLGLTPFTGMADRHELVGASSHAVSWLVGQLGLRGEAIYPARSQEAFKLKWGPQVIEPEYMAFEDGPRLGAIWQILRLTRAI